MQFARDCTAISSAALRWRWNSREALGFGEREAARDRMGRQRFGKRAEKPEPSRIDPPMAALEQERIPSLLEKLSNEIALIQEGFGIKPVTAELEFCQ